MNASRLPLPRILGGLLLCLLSAPLQAQQPIDERRPLATDARVEVENLRGQIVVTAGADDQLLIRGTLGKGVRGLRIEGDQQRLRIKVDYPESGSGWGGWWGGAALGDTELRVELPRGVALTARSVSASIEVDGIDGPRLALETVSGGIRARSASAEVELDSVSGDAELQLSAARLTDLQTVSGDLRLRGSVSGRLKAEAVSGDLDLSLQGALDDLRLSVVSGDVELEAALARTARAVINSLSGDVLVSLPAATSARLRIETFSGRIDSPVGAVEKQEYGPGAHLEHRLGAGEADLRLESFSGNVRLRLR
jgi:hypothetical protein